jgi:hypothetical protein
VVSLGIVYNWSIDGSLQQIVILPIQRQFTDASNEHLSGLFFNHFAEGLLESDHSKKKTLWFSTVSLFLRVILIFDDINNIFPQSYVII